MKVTDYIVDFLEKKGIHDFFGYQGTMIAHFVDSVEKNPRTENHSGYHEQGAAFAACGYAQAKKACACAYATSGPGAANLLSGIANAYFDSLPVIFITGQLNTYEYAGIKELRQQGFQEINITAMAAPVTKYAVTIWKEEDVVRELNKAFEIANTGRKGPVLLDLPMNIQRGEIDPSEKGKAASDAAAAEIFTEEKKKTIEFAEDLKAALSRAKRPVILWGNGVDSPKSQKLLLNFAQSHQIPVITSVLAKSALPYDHPLNFGCIGGAYGHRYANMIANAKSDLLICLGISLGTRQIGTKVHEFAKGAGILRVDIDPANLQRNIHEDGPAEKKYCITTASAIEAISQLSLSEDYSDWVKVCAEIKRTLEMVDDQTPQRYTNKIIEQLSGGLADIKAVAIDVGQHMVWSYQSFHLSPGQEMLFSGGHGAMGYSLPAAIGAYYALKEPVACICGDGGLQMNIQELQWVFREKIPVKIIVLNNNALGMIRHLQRDYFDNLYAGTSAEGNYTSCNFAQVADAYGIQALRIDGRAEVSLGLRFLNGNGPKLLEILLEPGTYAYPKTCLGEPIHNQQPYAPKDIYEKLLAL